MTTGVKRVLVSESGETPAKLQKLEKTLLQDLLAHQTEILSLEKQCSDEQLKLQQAADVKKQPLMVKRGTLYQQIPKFWRIVLENIPSLPKADRLDVKDEELLILDYLMDVKVEELVEIEKRKHVFTFTFKENPYFKETVLKKEVSDATEEGTLDMSIPEITWKENPLEKMADAEDDDTMSFCVWLMSETSVEGDFGHIFREQVWGNPFSVYEMEDVEENDAAADEGTA
eukprot:GEMP01061055.1.p1 GENE.GEMP01061055.1~~GEMP01061055.1.p1  ORF type:complete len:239 (+),score=66.47 GEMP01061055.1:31-717(+)